MRGFSAISAEWDQIARQSGYTDGSDPSRGPNWYNPTLMPTRDWSYQYKLLSARDSSYLNMVRANAAREGVVLDEQGNLLATMTVALTPGTMDLLALIDNGTFSVETVRALLRGFNLHMAQQSAQIAIDEANKGDAYAASTAAATVKLIDAKMPDIGAQDAAHAAVGAAVAVGGNIDDPRKASTLPIEVTAEVHDKIQQAIQKSTPVAPDAHAPAAAAPAAKKSWAPVITGAVGGMLFGGPVGAVVGGVAGLIVRK